MFSLSSCIFVIECHFSQEIAFFCAYERLIFSDLGSDSLGLILLPIYFHKNRPKWGMNRHFKPKLQYFRTYTLLKLLHRPQPNFALFVRGPDMRIANPKWWTSAIQKKPNKLPYLSNVLTDHHEIGIVMHIDVLELWLV